MLFLCGARGSGKSVKAFRQLCERASELELQIEFAKKFDIPYGKVEEELDEVYKLLDGGRKNETSSKKRKENEW